MNDIFIGIDLSMDSTGIVLRDNGKSYYLSILNKLSLSKNKKLSIQDIVNEDKILKSVMACDNVTVDFIEREPVSSYRSVGYDAWHRIHFPQTMMLSELIFNSLVKFIYKHKPKIKQENIKIVIESYSLGSATDNLIQICEITAQLKNKIFSKLISSPENFALAPGPSVKMFAGKGNYDKFQMYQAFIKNDQKDSLSNDKFYDLMSINSSDYWIERKKTKRDKKTKDIVSTKSINEMKSPISDLIDAYWISLYGERVNFKI